MDFSEVPIKGLLLVKQFRSQHFKLALLQLQCLFLYCLTIFLTLDLSKESIGFPDAELYGESFEKNYLKNFNYMAADGVTISSHIISFTVVLTDEPMSALCLQHYFGDHENLYISAFFYFNFLIDNAKSNCLDCVNSNIYSCILSLLKLHVKFCFMNWKCYIYLALTKFVFVRYANLFDF